MSQTRTGEERYAESEAMIRERILLSTVRLLGEKGHAGATAADVVEGAALSPEDFHHHFHDLDACILAAYDWVIDQAVSRFAGAYETGREWPEAVRRGAKALLDAIGEHPLASRMAVLEVPPIGPAAHARYRAAVERFAVFMQDGRRHSERGDELPELVEMMALGGAEVIIFDEIAAGRPGKLPEMLPEILFTLLVPFLGPEDAAAEMQKVATPVR